MGSANVIPGVSGGTIAFLTGIYGELLESIKSINFKNISLFFKGNLKEFWANIHGNFLLSLGIGLVASIFSLAKLMTICLTNYPVQTWSFFFGLVLVSTLYVLKEIEEIRPKHVIWLIIGIGAGIAISLMAPSETGNSLSFIFLCGAIAICTMILPGISGSFTLVILGKYSYIMEAVSNLDWMVLAVFAIGAIIGILAFSHLVSWLLKVAYKGTLCFLCGLMVGSLVKVWPWKILSERGTELPVFPSQYPTEPFLIQAIVFAIIGIAIVVVIETVALKKK
ncbi:MAG: DUF368 domain-containing protein [Bacteroidales bacterium]|nr:DUF368 domain-containing protein [Bacteroidales bacterium]